MPRTITLTNFILRVREHSDTVDDPHVTDAEITRMINASIAKLRNLLLLAFGSDFFGKSNVFTAVSGQQSYDLTNASIVASQDFFMLRGLDYLVSGTGSLVTDQWANVDKFNFGERNDLWNYSKSTVRYRLNGNNLELVPAPTNSTDKFRLHYIPYAPSLSVPTDTFDGFNGWEDWCIYDVAIQILNKQESDTQAVMVERQLIEKMIVELSQFRDLAPNRVRDIFNYFGQGITRQAWDEVP